MRFDDSLKTVLLAETTSDVGSQAAWRQLVDLIGRGRVAADPAAIARLRVLRRSVPAAICAASARALAEALPPAALVAFFAEESSDMAAPVLRTAQLTGDEWVSIMPALTPAGRSVLRHRRDLPADAVRALAAFGATDFVLDYDAPVSAEPADRPFAPLVDEPARPLLVPADPVPVDSIVAPAGGNAPRFEIADLVARIDAFNRERERPAIVAASPVQEPVVADSPAAASAFRFETEATGTVTWIDGVAPTPLVGMSLARLAVQGQAQVDGVVAGAYRRRSSFRDARLNVGGHSDAAGEWRLSGTPAFDAANGRFLGYRGAARRPRADESATPRRSRETSDALRQLVHELRTPTNAIAGFAELIETELLGPVPGAYRDHAVAIRSQASALIDAIDDLDVAARIEGDALELRPGALSLRPLVERAIADLAPLADLRGATVVLLADAGDAAVVADDRALDRLVSRLLAALVSAAGRNERLSVALADAGDVVTLVIDKPAALDAADDAEEGEGGPLLGTAFAMRLANNLAIELGGSLVVDPRRLTLRLPAAVDRGMGQASIN